MRTNSEKDIYKHATRDERTQYSAEQIVNLLINLINPESVVDVGCGVGTFLKTFKNRGITTIMGLDSTKYLNPAHLEIPSECFIDSNFEKELPDIGQKFDLALSLEVAEHLEPDSAQNFITYLTELSDCICFSAAIPGQGGIGHTNEQWPEYWIELFDKKNYQFIDCIRPVIWNDKKIFDWYKMNTFLYINRKSRLIDKLRSQNIKTGTIPSIVHPERFTDMLEKKEKEIVQLKSKLKKEKKYSLLRVPRKLLRMFR